jgi:hypothetical protein
MFARNSLLARLADSASTLAACIGGHVQGAEARRALLAPMHHGRARGWAGEVGQGDDDRLADKRRAGAYHLEDRLGRHGGDGLPGSGGEGGGRAQERDLGADGPGEIRLRPGSKELLPDASALCSGELQPGLPSCAQGSALCVRGWRRAGLGGGGRCGGGGGLDGGRGGQLHLITHLEAQEEILGPADAREGFSCLEDLGLAEQEAVSQHLAGGGVASLDDAVDAKLHARGGGISTANVDERVGPFDSQDIRLPGCGQDRRGQQEQEQKQGSHHLLKGRHLGGAMR